MDANRIEQLIREAIPDADVRAEALGGTSDHFQVTVVAASFEGKTMVAQHRMVYGALGDAMREAIHALALTTMTPDEFRSGMVSEIGKG